MRFILDQRTRLKTSLVAASTAVAMLLSVGGCVDDVGLVDRTGADKVEKTALEGIWMYIATVTDAPYSTAAAFTGLMNFDDHGKVVFDIQEKYLVAYSTIETIDGTEKEWKRQPIRKYWDKDKRGEFVEMYVGVPVARWPITSHYDVQRNYNTYNGAQSNEVVENTTDRPWFERDYIRVAWDKQEIGSFFFGLGKSSTLQSYLVGDSHKLEPDAMTIDPESGYIDHVIRLNVSSLGGQMCNVWDLSAYDCADAEVRVRHAFRRFDAKRDYQPIRYHNNEHQGRFGYFLTERYAYDSDWGPTYEGKVSFANRWNLWRNNFDYVKPKSADGEELTVSCLVDSECNRDVGERCQKDKSWFSDGYCAKPEPRAFKDRDLKPIIYWLNTTWPEEFFGAAYNTADGWNDVFQDAVAWKLFYEELGLATTRACDSHTDCTVDRMLLDIQATITDGGVRCYSPAQCTEFDASSTCGTEGYCVTNRSCGAGNPCALGQSCDGGLCRTNGQNVETPIAGSPQRGSTVVYHGDGAIVTRDNFSSATLQPLLAEPSKSFMRFVHAASAEGALSLRIGTTNLAGGEFSADRDYDPNNPANSDFVGLVESTDEVTVEVLKGGTVLKSVKASIVGSSSYIAIYNGEDVFVVGAPFNQSSYGVRFVHAAPNGGGIDFGLEGVKVDEDVRYRQATEFRAIAGDSQRVTLTETGSRGDLTCYRDDGIGRCVGWGPTITEDHKDRVATIKKGLPDMFVICENQFDAVAAFEDGKAGVRTEYSDARYSKGDYNPCGDLELVAYPEQLKKIGDTRYSMFYWVAEAMRAGPLGYGPSAADPDTGELIYAQANIYGSAIQTYSQYAGDLLDLVNGDLDNETVITGGHVRDFLKEKADNPDAATASFFGAKQAAGAGANKLNHTHDMTGHMPGAAKLRPLISKHPKHDWDFPELAEYMRDPAKLQKDLKDRLPHLDPVAAQKRLSKLEGTWLEDLMINNEVMLAAAHIDPAGDLSFQDLKDELSPIRSMTKLAMKQERARMDILMKNNIYMADFVDDALVGLAQELKKRAEDEGWTPARVRQEIGSMILQGVLEHEVGHTIGLRHNFSGSTDVYNFHDEYYQIREKEPVLCREDSWCDDTVGELCAMQTCTESDDCFGGQECILDAATNAFMCSTPDDVVAGDFTSTGVCASYASDDACNSNADCGAGNYCEQGGRCVKPNVQFVPRSHMTPNERVNKRTQYQYTTTMDYGAKINSDVQGLGKYDYAAIKFAYTEMIDVYSDTTKLRDRVRKAASQTGQTSAYWSFYLNTDNWPSRGTGFWHAFNYLNNYIGVDQNLKRTPMPYELVKYQREMVSNDVRELNDLAFIEVPYAFCSDEFRGNMGCYLFDQGVDAGEMAANARQQLENYYIFDAFKRERMWFGGYGNPMSYYGRIMSRYMPVFSDVGMYYALWDSFLFRYSWYEEWKNMPMGGRMLATAAEEAFGNLRDTVSSPSPGCYTMVNGTYQHQSLNLDKTACDDAGGLYVSFGVGRYPYTQFGDAFGHSYFQHPLWFGSFWEKFGALLTLTDSTAYFADLYVGEQLNIGAGTSLGFNTVFAEDMNEFLGGIITGHLPAYAGRVKGGTYVAPSVPGRKDTDVLVEPSLNNFTLKLYASVLGLAYLPAGFDPQFIDRLAVFVEGEAVTSNHDLPGISEHKFVDPIGGKTYLAYSTNYGLVDAKVDVGARLVDAAALLATQWKDATGPEKQKLEQELHAQREMLDVLRSLHHIYGTSTLGF